MYLLDGSVVTSASDLKKASECEFAFLRELDVKLGRDTLFEAAGDAMMARAGQLGDEHEQARARARIAPSSATAVVEIERAERARRRRGRRGRRRHRRRRSSPAPRSSTRRRSPTTGSSASPTSSCDSPTAATSCRTRKLARHARVTALLQLAAYAEQLDRLGVACDRRPSNCCSATARRAGTDRDDIAPGLPQPRRDASREIIDDRVADVRPGRLGRPRYHARRPLPDLRARGAGAPRRAARRRAAGHAARAPARRRHHDDRRARDIRRPGAVRARRHARRAARAGPAAAPGRGRPARRRGRGHALTRRSAAAAAGGGARGRARSPRSPSPSPGDLFFDFEGDPLYTEGDGTRWGLDYLFGMVDTDEQYTAVLGAPLRRGARGARRGSSTSSSCAGPRTPTCTSTTTRATSARTSRPSPPATASARPTSTSCSPTACSSTSTRSSSARCASAAGRTRSRSSSRSTWASRAARGRREVGRRLDRRVRAGARARRAGRPEAAIGRAGDPRRPRRLQPLRLRVDAAAARLAARPRTREGVPSVPMQALIEQADGKVYEPSPLAARPARARRTCRRPRRDADRTALALAAAAIDYHAREAKSFWWRHFLRTDQPVEAWEDHRDVLVVDPLASREAPGWHREPEGTTPAASCCSRATSRPARGSRPAATSSCSTSGRHRSRRDRCARASATRPTRSSSRSPRTACSSRSAASPARRGRRCPWRSRPVDRRTPTRCSGAIAEWAAPIAGAQPRLPLGRRHRRAAPAPAARHGRARCRTAGRATTSMRSSHRCAGSTHSYLAVQGPPGTGKTYVASHVDRPARRRARLADRRRRAVARGRRERARRGRRRRPRPRARRQGAERRPRHGRSTCTRLDHERRPSPSSPAEHASHPGSSSAAPRGTSPTPTACPRRRSTCSSSTRPGSSRSPSTIAVARRRPQPAAARRPAAAAAGEPGHAPRAGRHVGARLGRRRARRAAAPSSATSSPRAGGCTRRSPSPCRDLSYEGELHSHPIASLRSLDGVAPGLTPVPVAHVGNATASTEEAAVVVDLVAIAASGGRGSTVETAAGPMPAAARPLAQRDLIVVTPYNAQLAIVRAALDERRVHRRAGRHGRQVPGPGGGGRDRVARRVIGGDAPRGVEFLLLKNRLNVAISRAKWAAYLVYSPGLLDTLPRHAEGVAQLSAFIRLVGAERRAATASRRLTARPP